MSSTFNPRGKAEVTMDALLSAALQEVAVEGIQGELQKNFKTASLICSRTGKLVV